MVVAPLLLVLASNPIAIARVVTADVTVVDADRRAPLRPTQLIEAGATIATGQEGWAELYVEGIGRVRLSAGSELSLSNDESSMTLVSGRAWILAEAKRFGMVRAAAFTIRLEPGHSLVLEARSGAVTVVTRGMNVEVFDAAGAAVSVEPGRTLRATGGQLSPTEIGGAGLADLVAVEARHHLGDRSGVDRFLFERITEATIGFPDRAGARRKIRGATEVGGAENGVAGALLEDGLRPPPFFEDEVPPKGPNVEVEVGFRD